MSRRCCCCFSLRSGMLILGWVQAILSIMSLCAVILVDSSNSSSSFHKWIGASLKVLYVLLGGSVIQTIAAGFLLYGVYRRKSAFVFEYVELETLLHVASLLEFCLYLALEHSTFSSDQIYTLAYMLRCSRRKSAFVFEYVKLETLLHVASLLEFCLYLALEHSTFSSDQIYTFLAFLALNYGLAAYYLLAAYSFYKTMTGEENTPLIQS